MKTLLIGIDGGDLALLQKMDLPRMNAAFQAGVTHPLTMEKFLRGWPVVLTGQVVRYLEREQTITVK